MSSQQTELVARASMIMALLAERNPQPQTELIYHNTFQLLVAVVLSAQATDIGVNKATASLFKKVFTPEDLLALGLAELVKHIKSIGLFNTKAKHLIALAQQLVEQHNSQVPADRAALERLPGVGRKTANVILNTCFGQLTIAVDTHIFRVARRLGLARGKTPLAVEQELLQLIPEQYLDRAHHWLVLHGRYICKARQPQCATCPLQAYCDYNL